MSRDPDHGTGRHLLVVAPNWLGDVVMATSLLDALSSHAGAVGGPRPRITLCVRRCWRSLLEGDPRVDGILSWERTGRHAGPGGLARLARDWRRTGADAVILLPPSLRVALAAWLGRIPRRIGHASDARGALLTHGLPEEPRGRRHYCEETCALGAVWAGQLRPCGVEWPAEAPLPSLPGLAAPSTETTDGPPVWAVASGATYGTAKTWPARRVVDLIDRAVGEHGRRVLLLGDAAARSALGEIRRRSRAPWRRELVGGAGVVDLIGRTSLISVASLLRGCEAFVGNDSGLMHLAAALGVPTVGLFGSSNPDWTGPRGRRAVALAAEGFDC